MAIMALSLMACQPKETSTKAASDTTDALTQVVISLDWVPNTNHTGLYVAQDKGYFKEQGLEVQIVQPSEDSASTLVANDRADFGIYFQPNMVSRLEKGVPITAVAAILQHNPAGLLSLKSLGAKSPKDLNGKRYSTWEDPIDDATVSHIVGNDLVKIPGEATDATVALRMNQFDYILAYYGWDGVHAKLKGVDTNFFFLRDYEPIFDYYAPVVITNNKLLNSNPQLVKKMLAAMKKGYIYAAKNPEESANILIKYAPETNKELALASQKYISKQYLDDEGDWGKFDYDRWDRFYDWVYKQGLIDKPLPPQAGVSNDYL
ncbi:ABC transporter substrate-binding protein [Psychrobacter sp. H7-1]|uniref:ABC transporter substrate-binding protein n=1 Tax=Psychrobacter sp. H7-1 TaxID=1569265 RepID=UPI00191B0149|nr:ABC transporter substrate-binding protein [Psychrobacter sp. H7-1]